MTQAIPPNHSAPPTLWGEYRCSLDADGYLLLPEQLADSKPFVLTKGLDGCLMLAPKSYFEKLSEKTRTLPLTNQVARLFRRHLFASATPVQPDGNNRIQVPEKLRAYAHLNGEAMVVGNDEYLEIWSVQNWDEVQARLIDETIESDGWQLEGI
jgi:MraZ protein